MTTMKKLLLAILTIITINVSAQLPDGSLAPDWTMTDLNGTVHHLYEYLDDGYAFLLIFKLYGVVYSGVIHTSNVRRPIYESRSCWSLMSTLTQLMT